MPVAATLALDKGEEHQERPIAGESPKLFGHCQPNAIMVQSINVCVRFNKLPENVWNAETISFGFRGGFGGFDLGGLLVRWRIGSNSAHTLQPITHAVTRAWPASSAGDKRSGLAAMCSP